MQAATGLSRNFFDSAVASVLHPDTNARSSSFQDFDAAPVKINLEVPGDVARVLGFLDMYFGSGIIVDDTVAGGVDDVPDNTASKTYRLSDDGDDDGVLHPGVAMPKDQNVKISAYRWAKLYRDEFLPKESSTDPIILENRFCEIRKTYRPNYKLSRKVRNKTWNHLSCSTCVKLKDEMKKGPKEGRARYFFCHIY